MYQGAGEKQVAQSKSSEKPLRSTRMEEECLWAQQATQLPSQACLGPCLKKQTREPQDGLQDAPGFV